MPIPSVNMQPHAVCDVSKLGNGIHFMNCDDAEESRSHFYIHILGGHRLIWLAGGLNCIALEIHSVSIDSNSVLATKPVPLFLV